LVEYRRFDIDVDSHAARITTYRELCFDRTDVATRTQLCF
jgi:hypothetical protein